MTSLDFARFSTVTFDCYGTLIDWETGALTALSPLFARSGIEVADYEAIQTFLQLDASLIEGAFVPYREILAGIVRRFGEHFGFSVGDHDAGVLARSIPEWRPFAETVPALEAIRRRYRIAIISNIDDTLIQSSLSQFGVTFDLVVTSEQARCYKPGVGIFEYALEQLGEDGSRVLHVAEGLSEAEPARRLGIGSVWVRRSERSAAASKAEPDTQVSCLSELVELMERQLGETGR